MIFDASVLRSAHTHGLNNRAEIERSEVCGCFYCLRTFPLNAIERWLNEGAGTAVCDECQIDSVIGDASGLPVKDLNFLVAMRVFWFGGENA
jgi:hypothetical protein